jgi:hypothetical protein
MLTFSVNNLRNRQKPNVSHFWGGNLYQEQTTDFVTSVQKLNWYALTFPSDT